MTTKLPIHEWCIILLFCLILLALAAFALVRPKTTAPMHLSHTSQSTPIQIKIEGQVAKPGFYRLPLNATLQGLLEQAQPLPTADLSHLNGRRKLRDGQAIHIPERYLITIQIAGAVQQPGSLQILSGTRYCELAEQLQVLPNADLKSMRKKKKFVKEGECIEIPIKKQARKKQAHPLPLSSTAGLKTRLLPYSLPKGTTLCASIPFFLSG